MKENLLYIGNYEKTEPFNLSYKTWRIKNTKSSYQ